MAIMVKSRLWLRGGASVPVGTRPSSALVRRICYGVRRQRMLHLGMYLVGTVYNFCTPYDTLTQAQGQPCTPAMAAGLTDHVWSVSELLSFRVPPPRWQPPRKRGRRSKEMQRLIRTMGNLITISRRLTTEYANVKKRFTSTRVGKTQWRLSGHRGGVLHPHACGEDFNDHFHPIPRFGSPPRVWGRRYRGNRAVCGLRFTPTRVGKTRVCPGTFACASVHPHACGEDSPTWGGADYCNGSPPRVGGRRPQHRGCPGQRRFTPTRVGKTVSGSSWLLPPSVHPHACGEDRYLAGVWEVADGSPPRVWGRHAGRRRQHPLPRFTPTRVGKTVGRRGKGGTNTVHPHACGEDHQHVPRQRLWIGSPPRVWGRRQNFIVPILTKRFTPTRVGKTVYGCPALRARSVHPHACGEDACGANGGWLDFGSPPRVWGRRRRDISRVLTQRFTPTRVGKTGADAWQRWPAAVHPHACGEDSRFWHLRSCNDGSPPRVWGRRVGDRAEIETLRFTPTRVGKTSLGEQHFRASTVHPHACGEDTADPPDQQAAHGSPPRVWGRRRVGGKRHGWWRFTPTRVGKTLCVFVT